MTAILHGDDGQELGRLYNVPDGTRELIVGPSVVTLADNPTAVLALRGRRMLLRPGTSDRFDPVPLEA